jgi:hypothetical protein
MATSGTIYGTTSNSNISVEIDWSLEQSISGNYSQLTATLRYHYNDNYPSGRTWGTGNWGIIINGVEYSASKYVSIDHNGTDVISNTVTISHNADGTHAATSRSAATAQSAERPSSLRRSAAACRCRRSPGHHAGLSASSVDMGSAVTIDLTGAASDSFTHDLTYHLPDGTTGTIATGHRQDYAVLDRPGLCVQHTQTRPPAPWPSPVRHTAAARPSAPRRYT